MLWYAFRKLLLLWKIDCRQTREAREKQAESLLYLSRKEMMVAWTYG